MSGCWLRRITERNGRVWIPRTKLLSCSDPFSNPALQFCLARVDRSLPLEVGQQIRHVARFGRPLTFLNCPFREGGCACSRGLSTVCPLQETKTTSVGLPKTVNQPNIPSCLLPPPSILLLLPTYGRSYFASSWGIKMRVSSGQRGRNGDAYQSAMNLFPITALLPS